MTTGASPAFARATATTRRQCSAKPARTNSSCDRVSSSCRTRFASSLSRRYGMAAIASAGCPSRSTNTHSRSGSSSPAGTTVVPTHSRICRDIPSQLGESWLPPVMTMFRQPASEYARTTNEWYAFMAEADGAVVSNTSPATSSASGRSALICSSSHSRNATCSADRSSSCRRAPRCQSLVWIIFIAGRIIPNSIPPRRFK